MAAPRLKWLMLILACAASTIPASAADHLQPEPSSKGTRWHLEAESAAASAGDWTPHSVDDVRAMQCFPSNDDSTWLQWEDLSLQDDEYNLHLSWAHNAPSTWITGNIYAGANGDNLRQVDTYEAVTFTDESTLQWNLISRALPLLATDRVIRITTNTAQSVYRQYIDELMLCPYMVPARMVSSLIPPNLVADSSLRPKGEPGPELILAESAETKYVVLLPAEPTSQEKKAAQELALHLRAITQADFPVVSEDTENLSTATKIISVGRTQKLENTAISAKDVDLSDEGYAISVHGEDLFLFGGRLRGPLFAVYALLEEDLQVRWFAPDYTSVPRNVDLKFRPVLRTYVPQFQLRQPHVVETDNEVWSLRNHVNAMARYSKIRDEWGGSFPMGKGLYFVHTFNELVPQWKHFDDHPEYFSMRDGRRNPRQLCASNPDVAKIIISELCSKIETGREVFSVSANDGGGYCQCPECRSFNDAEQSGGAALLRLVNNVAQGVNRKYPHVRVIHLAYTENTDIAPRELSPHPNVIVQFATSWDGWRSPFIPYRKTDFTSERVNGWRDKNAKLIIWDYVTNYSHALLPFPNMKVVAENIRFFAENNASGIFLEGNGNLGSERAALRSWVWAKLLWNPSLDWQALIREFTYGYYGPAAEPMQQYNELLARLYDEHYLRFQAEYEIGQATLYHIRFDPSVVFLTTRPYIEEATQLFDRAEELARQSSDEDLLRRVKLANLPLLYTKLCRGPGMFYHQKYQFYESRQDYSNMIDEFESIVQKEGITVISESRDGNADLQIRRSREQLAQVKEEE